MKPSESDTCDKCGLHKNECRCSRGKAESPSEEGKEKWLSSFEKEWKKRRRMSFAWEWIEDHGCVNKESCLKLVQSMFKELEKGDQEELWNNLFSIIYGNTLDPDYSNRHEIVKSKFIITRRN